MNKFINLTLILLVFFLGFYKVDAAVAENWVDYVKVSTIAHGANCNDTSCYISGVNTSTAYDLVNSQDYTYYYVSSIYTKQNGNGMMWVYNTDTSFRAGYLYSIRTYLCNSSNVNYAHVDFTTGNSVANTHNKTTKPTYWQSVATNVVNDVFFTDAVEFPQCGFVTHFFVPSVDSQYVGVQITTTESVTGTQSLMGYAYDSLGLYTPELRNQIDTAIQDSNLATAEDIDILNEEIQEMTTEQQQTNEKLDDVNDSLNYGDDLEFDDYDGSYVDDHNKQEADLLGSAHVNENIFNISIGTGSNSLIWDIVESAINSNAIVFSTIITMLSLGFIALVLNR